MPDTTIYTIATPCILLDRPRLLRNIASMSRRAKSRGLALRPHAKTHKSTAIARLQLEAGADGITVATLGEALAFIGSGVPKITVAYPQTNAALLERIARTAADHGVELACVFDSEETLGTIAGICARADLPVDRLLKIDVGLHRCGVAPESPTVDRLARLAADIPHGRFVGIISHAGHAYGATGIEEVRQIAREERAVMLEVAERLGTQTPVTTVSVGSTPTVIGSETFDGITEIRPGNYVFLDRTQIKLGIASTATVALTVLATVVSSNARHAVVDAGSKALSSDVGPHGTTRLQGYGTAFAVDDHELFGPGLPVEKLSEEHGFVAQPSSPLKVGDRLRILPNHSCVVANLHERYHIVEDRDRVVDHLAIDARSRL